MTLNASTTSSPSTAPSSVTPPTPPSPSRKASAPNKPRAGAKNPRRSVKKVNARTWRPNRLQWRYLEAAAECLAAGKPYIQREIAESVQVAPETVSRWNQREEFRATVDDLVVRTTRRLVERAHQGQLRQAERGNVVSYNAVMDRLERHGRIATVGTSDAGGGVAANQLPPGMTMQTVNGVQVFSLNIPPREPFESLPPARTLPATPAPTPAATPTAGV